MCNEENNKRGEGIPYMEVKKLNIKATHEVHYCLKKRYLRSKIKIN